jgi:preprotein translocase SecE subunit
MLTTIKNYLVGSYQEMRKVTWPTKAQTFNYSALVVGLSIGMALFLGLLDYIFNTAVTKVFFK